MTRGRAAGRRNGLCRCALGLVPLLFALACVGERAVPRDEVAATLGRDVLIPLHQQAATSLAALAAGLQSLCEPGADREALGELELKEERAQALLEERSRILALLPMARQSWSRVAVAIVGPARLRRSTSLIDWGRVDEARIEAVLAGRDEISTERVRELFAADQRGLGTVDFLLTTEWPPVVPQPPDRACRYLESVATVAAEEAEGIVVDWLGEGDDPGYLGRLTGEATVSLDPQGMIDDVVREIVFGLERLIDLRMEQPRANDRTALPPPTQEELLGFVEGVYWHYYGHEPPRYTTRDTSPPTAIGRLVLAVSPETHERIGERLEEALSATQAGDLESQRTALKKVQEAWSTELVSVLGVIVGFGDNDGDTG